MTLISNWNKFPEIEATSSEFRSQRELESKLSTTKETISRGNGRCYGDSSLNNEVLSCLAYNKFLLFDRETGVLEVESGILLDDILKTIVPSGWFLPVTPGTKFITIGGAVASDVHGKNHHVDGSISNHIISLQMMLADGSVCSCSRTEKTDLFWATCGGMGLSGIILSVKFQLKKIESSFINTTTIKASNLDQILDLFEENSSTTYSVAWIDCLKGGKGFGRSLLMNGEHFSPEKNSETKKYGLQVHKAPSLNIPINLPSFVLNTYSIKLFNSVFYNKNLSSVSKSIDHYEGFFYPLDSILNWNRMYGKRGFVQYQFVLPIDQRHGLEKILKKIQEKGMGSFLAVLKTFGEQNDLISFPMKGYTLALDFAIRDGLFDFLDELDKIVLEHGGRLYLTKDVRMKKNMFWEGYPRAQEFVDIIKKYNPESKINSMLSKRLEII